MRWAVVNALAASRSEENGRDSLAVATRTAAELAMNGAIILSPFHARIVLEERPMPPVFADYTDLLLFWSEILVIATLILWGASLLLRPRRVDFGPLLIRAPVGAICFVLLLAVPFARSSTLALFNAVTIIGFVGLALYVLNEVKGITQVLPAIGIMIFVQATVAITQVVGQDDLGLRAIGELPLDPTVSGVSILWTADSPALLRAYGLSDHPNILGGVLAAALLVGLAGLTRYRDGALAIGCAIFGVGVAALFVTFSRSAALGLTTGLTTALVLIVVKRDWTTLRPWLAACAVALLITVPLIGPYLPYLEARVNPSAQPAGSTEERALSEREALARNTNEIFVENPVFGVGAGVLPVAMMEAFPDFPYHYSPAHVVILVVAAETGILGAFAYGVLVLAPWLLLWLRRDRLTPELIGVSGALIALTVIGLFDYYTWTLASGRLWFWLVVGLWLVAYRRSEEDRSAGA